MSEASEASEALDFSNAPRDPRLAEVLDAPRLAEWWEYTLTTFDDRVAELLAGFARFAAQTAANGVQDDVMQGKAATLRRLIHEKWDEIEALRVKVKAPVLVAQGVIDAGAKARLGPLEMARAEIDRRSAVYVVAKAEAVIAAADISVVPPSFADAGRVKSADGAMVSPKLVLDYEVVDLAKVPREYLALDNRRVMAAGNAAVKANAAVLPEIPGIKWVWRPGVTMR